MDADDDDFDGEMDVPDDGVKRVMDTEGDGPDGVVVWTE